jgi:hypothetical protein
VLVCVLAYMLACPLSRTPSLQHTGARMVFHTEGQQNEFAEKVEFLVTKVVTVPAPVAGEAVVEVVGGGRGASINDAKKQAAQEVSRNPVYVAAIEAHMRRLEEQEAKRVASESRGAACKCDYVVEAVRRRRSPRTGVLVSASVLQDVLYARDKEEQKLLLDGFLERVVETMKSCQGRVPLGVDTEGSGTTVMQLATALEVVVLHVDVLTIERLREFIHTYACKLLFAVVDSEVEEKRLAAVDLLFPIDLKVVDVQSLFADTLGLTNKPALVDILRAVNAIDRPVVKWLGYTAQNPYLAFDNAVDHELPTEHVAYAAIDAMLALGLLNHHAVK